MNNKSPGWQRAPGVAVLVLLAACWSSATTTTAPTTTAPTTTTEPPEVLLRVALIGQPKTDNPWTAYAQSNDFWSGYANPAPARLYAWQGPTYTLVPQVAADAQPPEPVEVEGGYAVTVNLRDYVTWSDGEPVTADDLVFTFETVKRFGGMGRTLGVAWLFEQEADNLTGGGGESAITAVEALGPTQARITFATRPGLSWWPYTVGTAPIFPAHYWRPLIEDLTDVEDLYALPGLGSPSIGAFESTVPDQGWDWTNQAIDNYWNQGARYTIYGNGAVHYQNETYGVDEVYGPAPNGEVVTQYIDGPYVDKINYQVYEGTSEAALAVLRGEADLFLSPLGVPRVLVDSVGATAGSEFVVNERRVVNFLAFNLRKPPMERRSFRQALACVIDRKAIATDTLNGQAVAITSMAPPGPPLGWGPVAGGLCDDIEDAGPPGRARFIRAVEMLREAGFTWQTEPVWEPEWEDPAPGEGLTAPDGVMVPDLTLRVPGDEPEPLRQSYAERIAVLGRQIGLPINVAPMPFEDLVSFLFDPDNIQEWDMYLLGWTLPEFPGYVFDMFRSSNDLAFGGVNASGFSSTEFDELARRFDSANTIAEGAELLTAAEGILAEEAPQIFLFHPVITEVVRSDLDLPFRTTIDGLQYWFLGVGIGSGVKP
jgi:peptide/nickel transport system substrate-binding protein